MFSRGAAGFVPAAPSAVNQRKCAKNKTSACQMGSSSSKFPPLFLKLHIAMSTELMTELLEAGVHFGHQSKRWNPKMKPFIFEKRNALHIINLGTTVHQLDAATKFLSSVAARGGKILFVGCKKQAQEAVIEAAQACGQYYVNQRWLGGTLTNRATVRKSVARMIYIEQLEKQPEYSKMGNQEISALRREGEKLKRNLEGIRTMEKLPDAMIVIDTVREGIAIQEAKRLKIPTVAIVDTNADPDLVTYPIAGNDDAIRAIRVVLQKLVDAIVTGAGGHPVPAAPEAAATEAAPQAQDLSAVSE
jgi:small subunit ribosomal protein S2